MFKCIYLKTNYYWLLNNKKLKLVKNYEKYSILYLILNKNRKVDIGKFKYLQKKNYIIEFNKPFFFFNITKYPKSYPFKHIKS